jgi:hypothetical protein
MAGGPAIFGASQTSLTGVTNASVALEVGGTTKALMLSRLTDAQRTTLTGVAVADGMQLYDSTRGTVSMRQNGRWNDVPGWNVVIVKSVDETVTNSAALQDDDELQFSVLANETWQVELNLGMSGSSATADGKVGLTASTGSFVTTQSNWSGVFYGATGTLTNSAPVAFASTTEAVTGGTPILNGDAASQIWPVFLQYRFRASANATIKVQFANNTATASQTTKMEAGSMLRARRIS